MRRQEMGGRRTTKQELTQLEALTEEGLTAREIAQKRLIDLAALPLLETSTSSPYPEDPYP